MAIPVTQSNTPLFFDAIPAVKVRYYNEDGLPVYTYARLYALGKQLAVNLCAFERKPSAASRIDFCIGDSHKSLLLSLGEQQAELFLQQSGQPLFPLPTPPANHFTGEDEQGWHWGASFILPASALQQAGVTLTQHATFRAAVCKRWEKDSCPPETYAFGASASLAPNGKSCPPENWDTFTLVAY